MKTKSPKKKGPKKKVDEGRLSKKNKDLLSKVNVEVNRDYSISTGCLRGSMLTRCGS